MSSNSTNKEEMFLTGPGIVELRSMSAGSKPVDLWDYLNTVIELPGVHTIVCVLCNCQIWIKMEEEELHVSSIKEHLAGNHHKQVVRDRNKDSSMETVCHCSHHGSQDMEEEEELLETYSFVKKNLIVSELNSNIEENKKKLKAEFVSDGVEAVVLGEDGGAVDVRSPHLSTSGMIGCSSSRSSEEKDKIKQPLNKNKCLGVFNLSKFTTEDRLERRFGAFGKIERVKVTRRYDSSISFGFIYFVSAEDATKAKEGMNGVVMDERKLRVDYSITTGPRPPTPGIGYQGHHQRSSKWRSYGYRSRSVSRGIRGYGG